MKRLMMIVGFGLLTLACDKPAEPAPEATPAPVKTEKAEAPKPDMDPGDQPELAPEEPTTQLGDLPVAEDLEEEAEKTISADNLEAELDRIEMEIEG